MKNQFHRESLSGSGSWVIRAALYFTALSASLWIIVEPTSPVDARTVVTIRVDSTEQPRSSEVRQKVLKNRLLFPDGKVLVVLPKGLRAFTKEDFDRHYGNGVKPEYAFIDDSTDSRFSVSVTKTDLAPAEVETYRKKMEADLARSVQGLIWHKREMLQLSDRQWAHLEMQNPLSDGTMVMTDLYVTSMGGHPLIFTVTTSTKHWYDIRKVMQKMMLSVMIQERVVGDPRNIGVPPTSDK